MAKILGQSTQVHPELSVTQVIKSVVRELLGHVQREGWLFLGWIHTPVSSMKQLMLPGRQTGSKAHDCGGTLVSEDGGPRISKNSSIPSTLNTHLLSNQ